MAAIWPDEAANSSHAEWRAGAGCCTGVGSRWGGQASDVDARVCFAVTYNGRNISTSAVGGDVCRSEQSVTEEWTERKRETFITELGEGRKRQ